MSHRLCSAWGGLSPLRVSDLPFSDDVFSILPSPWFLLISLPFPLDRTQNLSIIKTFLKFFLIFFFREVFILASYCYPTGRSHEFFDSTSLSPLISPVSGYLSFEPEDVAQISESRSPNNLFPSHTC